MENLTGMQFGAYQIIAPLGEGGMAAVYKAYQPATERHVALKVLPRHFAKDAQFSERFQREAKFVAQLQHPHILPVFDYGQSDDYTYIVMPFIQGGTLTGLLKGQPLSLSYIRQVISQIGDALNYAHAHGLVHRDVKPSNILVDESGNCLLTDFGLARMVEDSVKLTTSGTLMGTPAYMSPEQGAGQEIDARSDIYSLGVVLYEMATGRVPFRAETPLAVVFKHIQDPLPSARSINPALPEAVELVILKALSKSPADRYQTAGEMVRAIQAAIPEDVPTIFSKASPGKVSLPQDVKTTTIPVLPHAKTALPVWLCVAMGIMAVILIGGAGIILGRGIPTVGQSPSPTAVAGSALAINVSATPTIPVLPTSTIPMSPTPTASATALPTPITLFQENFEDNDPLAFIYLADGTWKRVSDEAGNHVYEIDNRTGSMYPQIRFGSPYWKDYTLEYRTRFLDFTSSNAALFSTLRTQDLGWYIPNLTTGSVAIFYHQPNPSSDDVLEFKPFNASEGIWYSIRVEAYGEHLQMFLDDSLMVDVTDGRVGQGDITLGVGPWTYGQFDDIRVTAPGK